MIIPITKEFTRSLLDAIYPPLCPGCQSALKNDEELVCKDCLSSLEVFSPPFCDRCGYPIGIELVANKNGICRECPPNPIGFLKARSLFSYQEEVVRNLIHALKYSYLTTIADLLGEWVDRYIKIYYPNEKFDAIVPVPLHWKRQREREFNQSKLLSQFYSRNHEIKIQEKWIIRKRATPPQSNRPIKERHINISGAFHCPCPKSIEGSRILLVDDVMTTGATVNEVSRVLMRHGAKSVHVITVARTLELSASKAKFSKNPL